MPRPWVLIESQVMGERTVPSPTVLLDAERQKARGLERLYRGHAAWLRRALGRRLHATGIEVEDIVQDTYMRAARYSEADANRHPRALLFRIALNLARDQLRRTPFPPANDVGLPAEPGAEGDQEYLLMLKTVILDLPPELRHVFLLSRFSAMTNVQVARQLGISVKAVEWRIRKALLICTERLSQ